MKRVAFLFGLGILLAQPASAALYDLKLTQQNVTFNQDDIIAKRTVRIYATVENVGERDTEATIEFFDADRKIGSKALSVRTGGRPDEVWMEWTPVSEGNHFLRVRLVSDPDTPDENPDNGTMAMDLFVDRDTDGDGVGDRRDLDDDNDGVLDTEDQFPLDPKRQKDTDGDGIEDKNDSDMDNDGLTNNDEVRLGTSPVKRDTDGDGVGDKEDIFPLDPTRSKASVENTPQPVKTTKENTDAVAVRRSVDVAPVKPMPVRPVAIAVTPGDMIRQPADASTIQPVTTSVLAQIGVSTTSELDTRVVAESAEVSEFAAALPSKNETDKTIPAMIGLALLSACAGAWFLLKGRGV